MLSEIKPKLSPIINFVARPFLIIHPNILSLIGLIFPILFLYFMTINSYWWAGFMLLGSIFDTLDGAVAKITNRVTKFGALLDSTLDRISDGLIILGFYYSGLIPLELTLIVLIESYLISYIRSRSELAAKGEFVLSVGIIERPERIVLFMLTLIFAQWGFAVHTFVVLAILSLITILQRLIVSYRRLKNF